MESRNIRVNSSDTLIKAAKSIGLNWYSWRLSSQERRSPQAAPKIQSTDAGQRDYVSEVKAIKLFQ